MSAALAKFAVANGLVAPGALTALKTVPSGIVELPDNAHQWQVFVNKVTDENLQGVHSQCGLSLEFLRYARTQGWFGLIDLEPSGSAWAHPLRDGRGVLVGFSYAGSDGEWPHEPSEADGCVFYAGNANVRSAMVFSSIVDAFSVLDAFAKAGSLEFFFKVYAVIVTFGPDCAETVARLTKNANHVHVWPANMDLTPNGSAIEIEKWVNKISIGINMAGSATVKRIYTPGGYQCAAEWYRTENPSLELAANVISAAQPVDLLALPTAQDGLPLMIDACQLITKPPPLPDDVIKGILHESGKMVLGGGSKSFKTWSLAHLARCVATGEPWWGFPTIKGDVLYINFELHTAFFAQRLKALGQNAKKAVEDGALTLWNLRGYSADINVLEARILQRCASRNFSLIIFDPIYKMLGDRDENKAGDIASLSNALERIAVATGAAVAYGAHFAKGDQAKKDSIDRIGGSGVFARDPDAILTLTRHEEKDAFTVDAVLRNHAPVAPFVLRWEYPFMKRDEVLDPSKLHNPAGGRGSKYTEDEMTNPVLGGAELKDGEWFEEVHGECGMGQRTFHAKKKGLIAKHIVVEKHGKFRLA